MKATTLILCLLTSLAAAQDLAPKAAPQERPVAIVNAVIHPVSGPTIPRGYITFDQGRITTLGSGEIKLAEDHLLLDADGAHVYPGLVAPFTNLGLVEIGSVRATRDFEEAGLIRPEVRAAPAINPDSTLIPVARTNGILTAGVFPRGAGIPGRASVIRLEGWTWEDMAIRADAGLFVSWPPPRPIRAWWNEKSEEDQKKANERSLRLIRDAFAKARAWAAARDEDSRVPVDIRWEAMRPVFDRIRPVFFAANDYDQIVAALAFAREQGVAPVIVGGRDAPLCLDLLKENGAAVILTGTYEMPKRRDSDFDERFRLPSILEAAGIHWCLASGQGASNERNLPYAAAMAVAFGLNREAAIRAITLSAARILGVGTELGSLETGKRATLMITDGDPLRMTTKVLRAFIDGRAVDLSNKQTALADKYREKYRQLGLIPRDGGK